MDVGLLVKRLPISASSSASSAIVSAVGVERAERRIDVASLSMQTADPPQQDDAVVASARRLSENNARSYSARARRARPSRSASWAC
jgi:hypothetical protein